jgi:hypothetical protein
MQRYRIAIVTVFELAPPIVSATGILPWSAGILPAGP